MPPLVSVIIPTYNRASLVTRAVESVLSQEGTDLETLVVDDGSTDNTADVLKQYRNAIQVIWQDNAGVEKARNFGAQQAQGDYVWFLDSDDRLLPGALTALLAGIKQYPAADVLYGWAQITDHSGQRVQWARPTANGRVWKQYIYMNPTPVGTFIVRRNCLVQVSFQNGVHPFEDWDFLLRLAFRVNFACVSARLAEIEYQPIRRSTNYPPEETLQSVRLLYANLLADPISGPELRSRRNYLEANAYVMLGHQYRVMLNDRVSARRAFMQAIYCAPTFRRGYVGLLQSLISTAMTRRFRAWRENWFKILSN